MTEFPGTRVSSVTSSAYPCSVVWTAAKTCHLAQETSSEYLGSELANPTAMTIAGRLTGKVAVTATTTATVAVTVTVTLALALTLAQTP